MPVSMVLPVESHKTVVMVHDILGIINRYGWRNKIDEAGLADIKNVIDKNYNDKYVSADVENCMDAIHDADFDELPYDKDGLYDLSGYIPEDLKPHRAMHDILWAHVPKPVRLDGVLHQMARSLIDWTGHSHVEFMCEAIKLRDQYKKLCTEADNTSKYHSIWNNYGDKWITELVDIYGELWLDIYNEVA